ncbi:MAG: Rpn family recombination-promoting nuclease/putative transposase [Chitinispirillia bacterium]|jgi:predicted transposase/invertase (TIGR01784 family)
MDSTNNKINKLGFFVKEKYINPFTDFGFKKIFGEELNKDLLIDFLNELLRGEQSIKDLTYKKNEHIGRIESDRRAIFDLYCEDVRGEKFIVELQKTKQKFFKDRSIYYSTFPITEQAELGDWNFELKAVYTVAILDFIFDDEDREKTVVSNVQLMDTQKKEVFFNKLTFIYLQMPNFNKTEDQIEDHFDKWLYIFKNLPKLHERPKKLQERVFEKLFSIAEIAKFTPLEVEEYEESLKVYRDLKNSIDTAREEGKAEGRAEGRAEGVIEGKMEVVENMIKSGEDIQKISNFTGITIEEIEALRKKYN